MTTANTKKLSLSKESAQFLLEGLKFFKDNPQAKDWHKLDKNAFLLLARDVAQFYPDEEESLAEYLTRFESFLQRIVDNEELAPSVPQNLEELVDAFEAFQKEKDAAKKLKEVDLPTSQDITLEDWIKDLQRKHTTQRIEKEINKETSLADLPKQEKEALIENIVAVVPQSVIPDQKEEKIAAEEIKNAFEKKIIEPTLKETKPLVEQISEQTRFLTVPPAVKPPPGKIEQNLIKAVSQVVKEKTPIKTSDHIQKTAERISQTLTQKVPKLTNKEESGLTNIEKITLTEQVINASLPEITQALTNPDITGLPSQKLTINSQDSQEFLQALTRQTAQPLLNLSINLRNNLDQEKKTANIIPKDNQEGVVFEELEKDPLLPYRLTPQKNLVSVADQMRQVVNHYGINQKSTEIIAYQNEDVLGLINSVGGKTSPWWQNQINRLRARGENQNLINWAANNFNFQANFEARFPQLGNFYQKAINWSGPKKWFDQITSPISGFLKEKVGGWWKNTAIAKKLAQTAKSKAGLFLKKTLGSFNVFKAGAKKTLQEGAKKGATKAVGWLAKKLASTKLGAALGSVAPVVGTAAGAVVGFGLDLIKGGFGLFSNTLQKITGGETEAERTIKANLGPLGKVALSPITLIIIGTPLLIIILALGLFQIEGSAFVVDEEVSSGLPFSSLPSEEPVINNHFAEQLVQILQDCPATEPHGYINSNNFDEVAQCLSDQNINSQIINILKESANNFCSLQCVAFVRAIEYHQWRTLPPCGDAKDYANCSAIDDSSVYQYTNCQNLNVGAIAVSTGGTYGHVGIITNIETSEAGITRIRFASAWGTNSTYGGRVTITTLPCDSFDTFIQSQD
jgi:surface antigen